MSQLAEYIWIDGQKPTKKLRSKTRVLDDGTIRPPGEEWMDSLPVWSFDGSSTCQADGHSSDLLLKPVRTILDPTRPREGRTGTECPHLLVLCEVLLPDERPHESNTRANLRCAMKRYEGEEPLVGIEQEYTLYDEYGGRPYRWPPQYTAFPGPQGPYYCGVGCDEVYGRRLVEAHLQACILAGIGIRGVNAEVMPSQWEFQIGTLDPLRAADDLWLARWLLYRMGEEFGISVKLDPKPISGDWNGAGAHTNFSTKAMREDGGLEVIKDACRSLQLAHDSHIMVYGADNHLRLTGKHETCDINTFRWGVADRGASVRIPLQTSLDGKGYLEDRRPAANADPYEVCTELLETICRPAEAPETD